MEQIDSVNIRPSPIAGSWYPANPVHLRESLNVYLDKAKAPTYSGKIRALILPHAGHYYSGQTAAYALKAIGGQQYSRVIILSPSHNYYPGDVLTSAHDAYQTPLGMVPVDKSSLLSLSTELTHQGFSLNAIRNDREHSIEIELPFLQVLLPDGFQLIPLMLMDQSLSTAKALSAELTNLILSFPENEPTLLIASSDLSHFYQQSQANRLDHRLIDSLQNFDPTIFYALKATHKAEACGYGAIATVLLAAKKLGASQVTIADYHTSGDISQDFGSVVGYVSAIISEGNHD
jgi:AmmeMemoRadiSam system protein B